MDFIVKRGGRDGGYEIRPVKEVDGNMEAASPKEAELFGVYRKGEDRLPVWVADFFSLEGAKRWVELRLLDEESQKCHS